MYAIKDSMWRGIWKILQNFLGTKQGLKWREAWSLLLLVPGCSGTPAKKIAGNAIPLHQLSRPAGHQERLHVQWENAPSPSLISIWPWRGLFRWTIEAQLTIWDEQKLSCVQIHHRPGCMYDTHTQCRPWRVPTQRGIRVIWSGGTVK